MEEKKPMTVADLIAALQALPDHTLPVCGYDSQEWFGVASGVRQNPGEEYPYDSLPPGQPYVEIECRATLRKPGVEYRRTEQGTYEEIPPDVYVCRHCGTEVTSRTRLSCRKCSWMPMMVLKEEYLASDPNRT